MNGRAAKVLRKIAREKMAGAPERCAFYMQSRGSAGIGKVWVITELDKWHNRGTVRGHYQDLKRFYMLQQRAPQLRNVGCFPQPYPRKRHEGVDDPAALTMGEAQ